MRLLPPKALSRRAAISAAAAAVGCAAAVFLSNAAWLAVVFCAVCALPLFLEGRAVLVLECTMVACYALLDRRVGDNSFSLSFAALGAGMLAAAYCVSQVRAREKEHEDELARERRRNDSVTLVSTIGQTRNRRAYQNDAAIYLKLTKRYQLKLYLALWRLENAETIKKQLGEDGFKRMIGRISNTMSGCIRGEDMLYLINENSDQLLWGTMHIANDTVIQAVVQERILRAVAELSKESGVKVLLRVADTFADDEMTPLSMLEAASIKMGVFMGENESMDD